MDFLLYVIEKLLATSAKKIHNLRLKRRKTFKELEKQRGLKLDLGSGGVRRKGYVGIDAILGPGVDLEHDLRKNLPLPDETVSAIRISHALEHLPHREVPHLLKECSRVLQPGGEIEIEVPDLESVLKKFLKLPEKERYLWGWEWIFGNQKREFEFHHTGFTKGRLKSLLKDIGFYEIRITKEMAEKRMPCLKARALKP